MMFTILEVSVYYPNPISVTYVQLVIQTKTAPFLELTYSTFNFKYSRLNECMNTNRTGNVSRFIDRYISCISAEPMNKGCTAMGGIVMLLSIYSF